MKTPTGVLTSVNKGTFAKGAKAAANDVIWSPEDS